jgi:UDP-N-acetylglucosamine transferase subunit ALG13
MADPTPSLPLVFVSVGTDYHQFDRLIGWIDRWLEAGGDRRARVIVQGGASTPPRQAEGRTFLPYAEMQAMTAEAAVVVCQAGPGTVALVSSLGKRAVIVPRRADLDEVVDDHQRAFASRLAADGGVVMVEEEAALHEVLDRALADPDWLMLDEGDAVEDGAVARVEALVEGLFRQLTVQPAEVGSGAQA